MSILAENIRYIINKQGIDVNKLLLENGVNFLSEYIKKGFPEPTLDEVVLLSEILNFPLEKLLKINLKEVEAKLNNVKIKLLALDVDGVLTDGGMYYSQTGDEMKKFNTKDGLAIKYITAEGLDVAFISSGINDSLIAKRAELLGVKYCYVGTWKKNEILDKLRRELNIKYQDIAYIGDDINDISVFEKVGLSACPADASNKIKLKADYILSKKGGQGCVREFIELFIREID